RGLELTVGMGRERNGLPIEFQIDLCVLDRTVVSEVVKIDGDVLAIHYADQLEEFRDGGKSRQCRARRGRGRFSMVVSVTGQRLRGKPDKHGSEAPCREGMSGFHLGILLFIREAGPTLGAGPRW